MPAAPTVTADVLHRGGKGNSALLHLCLRCMSNLQVGPLRQRRRVCISLLVQVLAYVNRVLDIDSNVDHEAFTLEQVGCL